MDKVDLIKDFQINPEVLLSYLPFTRTALNTSQIYEKNSYFSAYLNVSQLDP